MDVQVCIEFGVGGPKFVNGILCSEIKRSWRTIKYVRSGAVKDKRGNSILKTIRLDEMKTLNFEQLRHNLVSLMFLLFAFTDIDLS